jgi:hypothetical protein
MLLVGLLALIASAALFFMGGQGADAPQTGQETGAEAELSKLKGRIEALEREKAGLAAHVARLKEQLTAAASRPGSAGIAGMPGEEETNASEEGLTRAQKMHRDFKKRLSKYAKLLARLAKAQKEGKSPHEFMQDPDMLALQADMLRFMADLQKEFGIPYMEAAGGMLVMSFLLEPLCEELGVTLTEAQKAKLESGNLRLIEGLLALNEDTGKFAIEKSYGRMELMREYGGLFGGFLTEDQKKELGEFGRFDEFSGMASMMWSPDMKYLPESAEDQARAWRDSFGIEDESTAGQLDSIAREYLASYKDLKRRYDLDDSRYGELPSPEEPLEGTETERVLEEVARRKLRATTEEEKKQMEHEMLRIEVDALTRISGLNLTEEQKKRVRNYDPFSSMGALPRLQESKEAANEAGAISRLRTLSSAQELYNTRCERYAATFDELKEKNYIDKDFERSYEYTIEMGNVTKDTWSATATPDDWSGRHFYIDETGVIYEEKGRPADVNSKPLGG